MSFSSASPAAAARPASRSTPSPRATCGRGAMRAASGWSISSARSTTRSRPRRAAPSSRTMRPNSSSPSSPGRSNSRCSCARSWAACCASPPPGRPRWRSSRSGSTRSRAKRSAWRAFPFPTACTLTASAKRSSAPLQRRPVEYHLARPARAHGLEALEVFLNREVMRDDGVELQAALQQARHFVPGLEHLAPVDALERQALEDHLVPVDRSLLRRYAEDGDRAAMVHGAQHLAKRRGVAGHLQSDVEPLLHAEILHRLVERLALHVDGTRGAHLAGQLQSIVVDVRNHDVARA